MSKLILKLFCFFSPLFLCIYSPNCFAGFETGRVGFTVGGINWASTSIGIVFDAKGLLPDKRLTAGGELALLSSGIIVTPRVLFWQKSNLHGFYGGPIASIGVLNGDYSNNGYRGSFNGAVFGVGAEGGWLYLFPYRFDGGAALDLEATTLGLALGLKLNVGYHFR